MSDETQQPQAPQQSQPGTTMTAYVLTTDELDILVNAIVQQVVAGVTAYFEAREAAASERRTREAIASWRQGGQPG